jgi:hypothetical protein
MYIMAAKPMLDIAAGKNLAVFREDGSANLRVAKGESVFANLPSRLC